MISASPQPWNKMKKQRGYKTELLFLVDRGSASLNPWPSCEEMSRDSRLVLAFANFRQCLRKPHTRRVFRLLSLSS
jgi:hypothetical protein